MSSPPSHILNIHTPYSSFAIVHSLLQEDFQALYDKLTRKVHSQYHGQRVSPGWLKYEFNGTVWSLDDDSDYTIFSWRQHNQSDHLHPLNHYPKYSGPSTSSIPSSSSRTHQTNGNYASLPNDAQLTHTPTLHLHNPTEPLPTPPAYQNPAFYVFRRQREPLRPRRAVSPIRPKSFTKSKHSHGSGKSSKGSGRDPGSEASNDVPTFKREFEKFHGENGVRTVIGTIGPVKNVRMLLKSGYRHVYMSRKFALKHNFIPADAAPGYYGYGGLVNLGTWPITLTPSTSSASSSLSHSHPLSRPSSLRTSGSGQNGIVRSQPTMIQVYLSEEPHFDVVLGRSFFDRRQIRTNTVDPTDVVCLDTGEKIECELVILKDGRGEIVTVT
ncbi:hypothetical protein AMATHDRAFT_135551 [Amanita thiersii Skay4041]|uniref:Uncharacterized protein n=1 Tax=Amanita thiersii Skay4041 TaxID=703135 RepID=A0A2A9P0U6_9AGAR|nr:hypothetical protein AMATHDRAFT_135551 [Amanita thiersii Skay4041]